MNTTDPRVPRISADDDCATNHEMAGSPSTSRRTWAEQWAQHHGEIVRYVSYLLSGDLYAAEDVAQETAIRFWQHRHALDDGQPVVGWLRTVARNIVVDQSRRRGARPPETELTPETDPEALDEGGRVEGIASVTALLTPLSPRHRSVVFEVYVRDRPIDEVATDIGIPPGTVKSRCHYAMHQLRSAFPACA